MVIFTDGVSRGNPGRAAIGAIIRDERGTVIASISRSIGRATNNLAEYAALIAALQEAIKAGASQVEVRSDSELIVRQINGRYRVKNAALVPLHNKVRELQGQLESFSISHIPREQNVEADRLANMALD